ncbi:hypothetical protein RvY_03805 [Ramazzottius varieornatus]|uniref:Uncharacterized protein n=1 Tax=Ramazzottius varieornatus TaxID=947166 RepID=A0A1D1UWG3_RAMVA|nr:hypothetical protein RvY_03805 [Ramazzottius varieornatus]
MAMGRGGFGCGDDDANATKMGSPEVTGIIPTKALSSGPQTDDNSKSARSAEPAASIAPEALLIQLQVHPGKGDPNDQKKENSSSASSSNSTSFDIQISRN